MKKSNIQDIYPASSLWTPRTTIEEKAQYVKENMNLLEIPIQEEKVDEMLLLIKNDREDIGHKCHEWIEQAYFNLKPKI